MSLAEIEPATLEHISFAVEGTPAPLARGASRRRLARFQACKPPSIWRTSGRTFATVRRAPTSETFARAIERAGYHVGTEQREPAIAWMTCATCAGRVEKALRSVPDVTQADVNLVTEKASVRGMSGVLRPADLIAAVYKVGYDAELLTGDLERDRQVAAADEAWLKRKTWRVAAAAALSAPLMSPKFGLMLPGWLAVGLATPVQSLLGWRFYVGAWKAFRAGAGNMDLLVRRQPEP